MYILQKIQCKKKECHLALLVFLVYQLHIIDINANLHYETYVYATKYMPYEALICTWEIALLLLCLVTEMNISFNGVSLNYLINSAYSSKFQ